jgi:hypothetical protein
MGARSTLIVAEAPLTDATVAEAFDPAVLQTAAGPDAAAPGIHSDDAVIAEVNQTMVIGLPGETEAAIEQPAQTATIALPAAEPTEDEATSDAAE